MDKIFSHKGKKVYVAGHKGLAGSAIERRLLKEDCEIVKATHKELDLTNQKDVEDFFKRNESICRYSC